MPLIDEYDIERVRQASDIVAVVGSVVKLKRTGQQWKGLCPFHQEKTPSFCVSPERGSFHCFGCGAGGDVFRWFRDHDGLDFQSAVKKAAELAGITLDLEARPGLPHGKFLKLAEPPARVDTKEPWLDRDEALMWRLRPLPPELAEWFWFKGITKGTARDLARAGHLGLRAQQMQLVYFYDGGVKIRRELGSGHSCYWTEGFAEIPWLAVTMDSPDITRVCICEGESDTMRLLPIVGPGTAVIGMPSASWRPTPAMCWRIGAFREVVTFFDGDNAGRLAEEAIHPLLREHAKGCKIGRAPIPAGKDVCTLSQMFLTKALANPEWIR